MDAFNYTRWGFYSTHINTKIHQIALNIYFYLKKKDFNLHFHFNPIHDEFVLNLVLQTKTFLQVKKKKNISLYILSIRF